MAQIDRRAFLAGTGAGLAGLVGLALPGAALAQARSPLVMWKDPGCGCCAHWGTRIEAAFRQRLQVVPTSDMQAVKRAQGVPEDLHSCHTALIHGIVAEGHVPPADIRRLIATRNRPYRGLAVPGMPLGAPGMDVGHDRRQPYQVIAFGANNRRAVFANHG
jgi:hypothetical protein